MDEVMFQFYAANDGVRITDLHQGIVWGTQTDETAQDERLINRFDYDSDYGTCLNRFLMQAALGYPLTVYGTGGQSRAFIHIRDTVECVRLAVENPPERGDRPRILNQMTEVHKVRELARLIHRLTQSDIQYLRNPRKEAAENELMMANDGLKQLGLKPTTLADGLMNEVVQVAKKYLDRCDKSKILPSSFWTKDHERKCHPEVSEPVS
jgi:UDP-sulfoquinovose synthase